MIVCPICLTVPIDEVIKLQDEVDKHDGWVKHKRSLIAEAESVLRAVHAEGDPEDVPVLNAIFRYIRRVEDEICRADEDFTSIRDLFHRARKSARLNASCDCGRLTVDNNEWTMNLSDKAEDTDPLIYVEFSSSGDRTAIGIVRFPSESDCDEQASSDEVLALLNTRLREMRVSEVLES